MSVDFLAKMAEAALKEMVNACMLSRGMVDGCHTE
jgi:hypothetical protein